MRDTLSKTTFLALLGLGTALSAQQAYALDEVSYGTNWLAQAEHGGFYQAVADGTYEKHGLKVTIVQGGPNAANRALLIAGKVDFYMGSPLGEMDAVKQGIPLVDVAAIFQKDPQVLIGHPDTGFDSFEKLKGRTLLIASGGRITYWPYIRRKYDLSDTQLRPYNFNMAPFLADRIAVQQGFLSSEPFSIQQVLGRPPVVLLLADAGYSAYQTTIAISRRMATEKRDLVQRFVDASLEGWAQYLKGGAGTAAANALIKQANPEQTDERIDYAVRVMNERGIVLSGDALQDGIGAMSARRWQDFYESMVAVGVLPGGLDVARTHTLEFVNKGIGKA